MPQSSRVSVTSGVGARAGSPANLDTIGAVAARIAVPLQVAGGVDSAEGIQLAFAAGATRVVLTTSIADRPDDLRACLAIAGDWLAVGLDPRPERLAAFPWRRPVPPTVDGLVVELVGHAKGVGGDRPGQRDGDGLHEVSAAGGNECIQPTADVDSGPRFVRGRRRGVRVRA